MDSKNSITFSEFKAWLNGLVIGKGGDIPDLEDWKIIKEMMDRVVPDSKTEIVKVPELIREPRRPFDHPYQPYDDNSNPFTAPSYPNAPQPLWCTTASSTSMTDMKITDDILKSASEQLENKNGS